MGGRGGASGFSSGSGSHGKISSAIEAQNLQQLTDYMRDAHGIRIDPGVSHLDFSMLAVTAQSMEDIAKELPYAAGLFHEINAKEQRANAYASAHFDGKLQLSDRFIDESELSNSYASDVRAHWHPEGTDHRSIAVHEMGHLIERALIDKTGQSRYEQILQWNKHVQATRVIGEACKSLKRTAEGKGKTNAQFVAAVSDYAKANRSEALAECVADYRANGDKACALSREVWKILKRELS